METLLLEESEATLAEMIAGAETRECVVVFSASYYDRISEKHMNLITFYPG
jgi:hypothetical protein